MATQNPPLKLITSFPRPGDSHHLRIPSWNDIDRERHPVSDKHAPDYAVLFQPSHAASDASRLEQLLRALSKLRLELECRPAGEGRVLVFVRCPERILKSKVRKSRYTELFYGVRRMTLQAFIKSPGGENDESLTEAERLRIIFTMIVSPVEEGGAGITPGLGDWENVESIFPLANSKFTSEWIHKWSTEWLVSDEDFTALRNHYGEKVTLYFAFTQFYCISLIPLTIFGLVTWMFLPQYHPSFAIGLGLWTITFKHAWERRQRELAIKWGVKGFARLLEQRRAAFVSEGTHVDPVTGEKVGWFPLWKSYARRALFIPFGLASGLILAGFLTLVFAVEIYVDDVYDGPFKNFVVFTPTMMTSFLFPLFSNPYTSISKLLTNYENHRTDQGYENALTQKIFILTFFTGYMSLILTAFVYMPFGKFIVPKLAFFSRLLHGTSLSSADAEVSLAIDPIRLKQQVIYFAVTGQALQAVEEYFVPWLMRTLFAEAKKIRHFRDHDLVNPDKEEEKEFLRKVRHQVELPEYEVYEDYAEMVVQYGNIALWSIVWPPMGLACLINNWIEVRSDAAKIILSHRRPVPHRTDSIGPWLNALSLLGWLGNITTWALIYLYRGKDSSEFEIDYQNLVTFLVIILVAEHGYWLVDWGAGKFIQRFKTKAEWANLREDYILRKEYLSHADDDTLMDVGAMCQLDADKDIPPGFWEGKDIDSLVDYGKELLPAKAKKEKSQ